VVVGNSPQEPKILCHNLLVENGGFGGGRANADKDGSGQPSNISQFRELTFKVS